MTAVLGKETLENKIININIFIFIYYLIKLRSFVKTLEFFEKKYEQINDFYLNLFVIKIFLFSSKKMVEKTLSKKGATNLTWLNKIFFSSHDHKYGIGNVNYEPIPCLWQGLHQSLAQSINLKELETLVNINKNILVGKYGYRYEINSVLEEFVMKIWGQFCFGPNVDHKKYKNVRDRLITILRKTFYNNKTKFIPFFGSFECKIKKWWYNKELKQIDIDLQNLFEESNKNVNEEYYSFLKVFREKLLEYFDKNQELSSKYNKEINKILLDNIFLSVLVFDFIYMILLQQVLNMAQNKTDSMEERQNLRKTSITQGFLFPFRIRKDNENNYYIINLLKSEKFFSSGPRGCIGPGFFEKIFGLFLNILEPYKIRFVEPINEIKIMNSFDTPHVLSKHIIELKLPKNYLVNNEVIRHYEFKGIKNFWDITSINEKPALFQYVNWKIYDNVNKLNPDVIVTTEARGFLYAPFTALKLGIPLITFRKQGKLPGETFSESYQKSYDVKEILEVSADSDLYNKNVVIIDDGIASGETTIATHRLVEKRGGKVLGVIVVVKHNYTKCLYNNEIINVFNL